MAREIELKLEIDPAAAARLHDHPLLAGRESAQQSLLSVYFDTKKNKLRQAKYSLRVRRAGDRFIQTIKGDGGAAGLFDRNEWEATVAELQPERQAAEGTPLADLLRPADYKKLVPIVRSQVQRTTWLVDHDHSKLEVTLDQGLVTGGSEEQRIDEIEIELKEGSLASAVAVARLLGESLPLRIGVLSKSERGFALADGLLAKAIKAEPIHVDESMSVAQGFTAIFYACLRHFRLNEPLVVSARDAKALHQARVAMRRLRAAFSLFRPVLADDRYPVLREELRWFTAQLGEARNLDVFLEQLEADHPTRPRLVLDRDQAYMTIIDTLDSQRFRDLMLGLVEWVELGRWRSGKKAKRPLSGLATKRIDRLWDKIAPAGAQLGELEEEPRHRLRIDVKKLRYALEFVGGLHHSAGNRRKRFMTALEALQEELGLLNDMATARTITAELADAGEEAEGMPTPSTAPDEAGHLAKAESHFRRLAKTGRFWRGSAPAEASTAEATA